MHPVLRTFKSKFIAPERVANEPLRGPDYSINYCPYVAIAPLISIYLYWPPDQRPREMVEFQETFPLQGSFDSR